MKRQEEKNMTWVRFLDLSIYQICLVTQSTTTLALALVITHESFTIYDMIWIAKRVPAVFPP